MEKKHPCPDCHACQWCGDDRCRLCLGSGGCRKKLSIAEQIALFERLNAESATPGAAATGCGAVTVPPRGGDRVP